MFQTTPTKLNKTRTRPFHFSGRSFLDRSAMDSLVNRFLFGEMPVGLAADPRIDWLETNDAHVFKIDLPGWKKENIQVQLQEGNVLQIAGEYIKDEEKGQDDKWHCLERSRGNFFRQFRLPGNIRGDDVKAYLESGVLTVTVSKKPPPPKPRARKINISSKL